MYFKNGRAKVELALAKGKKVYDKREDIKRREAQREMDKAFKKSRF
jgi:SsrA-binding protein